LGSDSATKEYEAQGYGLSIPLIGFLEYSSYYTYADLYYFQFPLLGSELRNMRWV